MNPLNHWLFALSLLILLFSEIANLKELMLFALLFGALIDVDMIFGKLLHKPDRHLRTWFQEPFGFLVVGLPLGLILATIKPYYFFLVTIPYFSHIFLDYLTIHEAEPLTPFSKRKVRLGWIKPFPAPQWFKNERIKTGISENYVLLMNVIVLTIIILLIY